LAQTTPFDAHSCAINLFVGHEIFFVIDKRLAGTSNSDFQGQAKAYPFVASDPASFQIWKCTPLLSNAFDIRDKENRPQERKKGLQRTAIPLISWCRREDSEK
jgi:hypothetical protein